MIGTPLSSSGGVQVRLMHVLDALSTFGVPGGPESTKETGVRKLMCFYCSILSKGFATSSAWHGAKEIAIR